jgi:hypothetical protein
MADLEAKKMDGDLEIKKLRLIQKHELKLAKEKRRALKYGFASPGAFLLDGTDFTTDSLIRSRRASHPSP